MRLSLFFFPWHAVETVALIVKTFSFLCFIVVAVGTVASVIGHSALFVLLLLLLKVVASIVQTYSSRRFAVAVETVTLIVRTFSSLRSIVLAVGTAVASIMMVDPINTAS